MPHSNEFRSEEEILALVTSRAGERTRAWRKRRRVLLATAAVSAVAVIVLVALVLPATEKERTKRRSHLYVGPPAGNVTSTTLTRPPLRGPERWTPMAASPLSPRANPITAWTGRELLVWRGRGASTDTCVGIRGGALVCGEPTRSDGAAYDPVTDRWRSMAKGPLAKEPGSDISSFAGVWTGSELLIWGGPRAEGAAYDPRTDRWRTIARGPLEARFTFSMTWTGREAIILGGVSRRAETEDTGRLEGFDDGAAYNPATNRWRRLPRSGAGWQRDPAILTDRELVMFEGPRHRIDSLDLATSTWHRVPRAPLRQVESAAWTGKRLIAIGAGTRRIGGPNHPFPLEGASYDPQTQKWTRLGPLPGDGPSGLVVLTWTGREALAIVPPALGSKDPLGAAAFDPERGTWRSVSPTGLRGVISSAVVWTGRQLLVWGGALSTGFTSDPVGDGARYDPGRGH